MKTAVVILNYNGVNWLEKFLAQVIERSSPYPVVVIDNASTDSSVSFIKNNFSIQIIENKTNTGYAGGYNSGLFQLEFPYAILLNSDVEVTNNWIAPLEHLFESKKNIAAIQPKILAYNNRNNFEHAGAAGGFMDKNAYPFCRGRIFNKTEEDKGQYDDESTIFWASGACLFLRLDAFKKLGGFDPHFFAHMEEIDLCWRLKNEGYDIIYSPLSTVYHVGGGTLSYQNPKKTYLNFRNSLYTIHKNKSGILPLIIFKRLCMDGLAGVKFLVEGNVKHTVAIIRAHFDYYKSISRLSQQRKMVHLKNYYSLSGVLKTSVVVEYFLKKRNTFTKIQASIKKNDI